MARIKQKPLMHDPHMFNMEKIVPDCDTKPLGCAAKPLGCAAKPSKSTAKPSKSRE